MKKNSILVLFIWICLGITIYGQFYVIKQLRHSLIIVSGVERGMFNAQMAEHEALQLCRLSQYAVKPLFQSCYCENPGRDFLDQTLTLTPVF
jgi:hypothetical protein